MNIKEKQQKRIRRHKRVRAKISGTASCPRLCVFRSNKHIYAQLINDETRKTIGSASDLGLKIKKEKTKETEKPLAGKIAIAYEVGRLIAEKAIKNKIEKVVFDRGGYKYHGRVKALAEGGRNVGLKF
ncbi:MAG: 50S ribosomal protein L18 [Candidatus Pacebacteria bacterium]|nr:50S ribosomal protein L18 [Candidatus Paceibacterota bacterium]